ncbi:MAG TPA: hypothetical protein VGU46_01375 [Acidobacteriaceae bacterium]|nr:hypothetical protein [Acidobacteriaceae bacterium]
MTIEITNPEAIAEIEELMERFNIPASLAVERVMVQMGGWVPTEILAWEVKGETPVKTDVGVA